MSTRRISQADRSRCAQLMLDGKSTTQAATATNVSFSYAKKMRAQAGRLANGDIRAGLLKIANGEEKPPKPRPLSKEAQACLDDPERFADRYFGLRLNPWQSEAASVVNSLLDTPDREYLSVNLPPGAGKSTFFCLVIPAWLTVRNRLIRGLIGSASQSSAEKYLIRLRRALASAEPYRASPKEAALGLAGDAKGVLAVDYGTFKPDARAGLPWRDDAITVLPPVGYPLLEKEPTWQAFGRSGTFIGMRVDFQIWDDLYDPTQIKTAEAHEELYRWWDENVETRVEPGGLLVVQGQRLGPMDIYRHCLNKSEEAFDYDEEDGDAERVEVHGQVAAAAGDPPAPEGGEQGTVLPEKQGQYRQIVFRAHDEERCTGRHPRSLKPQPDSCLLDPHRLSWPHLARLRAQNPGRFATLYQQDDTPVGSTLVHPLWISGGTDHDTGEVYVGCYDTERKLGEVPLVAGAISSHVVVDPSPEQYWAVEWWLYEERTNLRHLIDIVREKMRAPDLIDWNNAGQTWTGIMPEWQARSRALGRPITHWIIEQNAAQRFLLQYEHVRRWMQVNSVSVVGHDTHGKNKSDPKLGVDMLAPHYRYGRVRLPGVGNRTAVQHLVGEVTRYPFGRTSDTVMAQWFFEFNLPRLHRANDGPPARQRRPSWAADLRVAR